jgi:hypothetical protein
LPGMGPDFDKLSNNNAQSLPLCARGASAASEGKSA